MVDWQNAPLIGSYGGPDILDRDGFDLGPGGGAAARRQNAPLWWRSGLAKTAIDSLEETAKDAGPDLDGLPVELIVTAHGWQATGSTRAPLRAIVHALRGSPTPLGVALDTSGDPFQAGVCTDPRASEPLPWVGEQVAAFALGGRTIARDSAA